MMSYEFNTEMPNGIAPMPEAIHTINITAEQPVATPAEHRDFLGNFISTSIVLIGAAALVKGAVSLIKTSKTLEDPRSSDTTLSRLEKKSKYPIEIDQ